MIEGSASLRYKLALSENGMCDDPRSRMTVAEKLELLTSHSAAWRRLHAVQHEWVESLVGWYAPLAVSGNIFVFSRECNDTRDEHEPVFPGAPVEDHRDLLVVRVPSPHRRIEGAKWMLWLPDGGYDEVCIDAAQDLLIYLLDRDTLCVSTLSTGLVHPSVIGHSGCIKLWDGLFNPRVCGEYMAAGTRSCFIAIWKWKTGELVSYQIKPGTIYSPFDFLDEHHILYGVDSEYSIHVYDWRCGELATGAIARSLCFELDLPPILHREGALRYVQIRPNALPVQVQERVKHELHEGDNEPTWALPFHADPRARLVSLRIFTRLSNGEERFELHVPAQTLLDHFAAIPDTGADMLLPWPVWHAETAVTPVRRVPYHVQAHMTAYGMRTVSHPPDWHEGVVYLDSYSPRRAGGIGARTRQCIPLPDKPLENVELLSTLCEDGLLRYQLDLSRKILRAFWFSP